MEYVLPPSVGVVVTVVVEAFGLSSTSWASASVEVGDHRFECWGGLSYLPGVAVQSY